MYKVYRCPDHENCTVVENKQKNEKRSGMRTHYDVLPEDHHPIIHKEKS